MLPKIRKISKSKSTPGLVNSRFQDALALHQRGELENARALYKEVLRKIPTHADSLHLLGVICYQTKQLRQAVDLIDQAIKITPNNAVFYSNRGNVLKDLDQLDAAVVSYDKAIQLKPDYSDAYYNRGTALQSLKQLDAAIASYDKAIQLKPDLVQAYSNRGNVLRELKQFDAAIASYDRVTQLQPDYVDAYINRGNALGDLKRFDAALASYDKAIQLQADNAIAYSNRGNILKDLNQFNAALASYDKAIQLKPDYAEGYSNRGNVLKDLNQLDAALTSYDKAIQLKADYADAYSNRGNTLRDLKRLDEAVTSYEKAIELDPDLGYLLGNLLHTRMKLCDWRNFESNVIELIKKIELGFESSPTFPILALTTSLTAQRKVSEIWVNNNFPYAPSLGPISKPRRSDKIRIGYFSADFRNHPISLLTAELFETHSRSKFELIAFSFGPDTNDVMRSRIKAAFDKFIDVTHQSDHEVAMLARSLEIDIAIDLGGHTQGSRLGIFALRAAPLQVSYLGYVGTMGAEYIDYLIADTVLVPEASQKYYSEKIIYLPSYQVNDSKRPIEENRFVREELGLPGTGFIFCCFNNSYKIVPEVFSSWMRILKRTEGSVLFLYAENDWAPVNLRNEAASRGVSPDRIIFGKKLPMSEYLARYQMSDLFLDTLPYNAGTTASDALWAGLPIVTRMGESFASRMAASLLTAINLPELITRTQTDYEDLAVELATDPIKYKTIKAKLAANRLTAPLFNTPLFSRHIEDAYVKIYERYQNDLLPNHIEIKQ